MSQERIGLTNADIPFERGEIVRFSDDCFIVETNHGESGSVLEMSCGTRTDPFYWEFEGERARRTGQTVKLTVRELRCPGPASLRA